MTKPFPSLVTQGITASGSATDARRKEGPSLDGKTMGRKKHPSRLSHHAGRCPRSLRPRKNAVTQQSAQVGGGQAQTEGVRIKREINMTRRPLGKGNEIQSHGEAKRGPKGYCGDIGENRLDAMETRVICRTA